MQRPSFINKGPVKQKPAGYSHPQISILKQQPFEVRRRSGLISKRVICLAPCTHPMGVLHPAS